MAAQGLRLGEHAPSIVGSSEAWFVWRQEGDKSFAMLQRAEVVGVWDSEHRTTACYSVHRGSSGKRRACRFYGLEKSSYQWTVCDSWFHLGKSTGGHQLAYLPGQETFIKRRLDTMGMHLPQSPNVELKIFAAENPRRSWAKFLFGISRTCNTAHTLVSTMLWIGVGTLAYNRMMRLLTLRHSCCRKRRLWSGNQPQINGWATR